MEKLSHKITKKLAFFVKAGLVKRTKAEKVVPSTAGDRRKILTHYLNGNLAQAEESKIHLVL